MNQLASEHQEIKIFRHQKNQGGGATRNTAVKESTNDVIFCLDSDDILGDGTLAKMLKMLEEKKCDGVGISTSIKFKKRDTKNIAFVNNFGFVGEKIPFESLLEKNGKALCPLYSTFMFTKRAFTTTGGYPTTHGFDTQGFAWRFLANGLIAYTCPNATYFHRIAFGRSYYIREYESGKLSHNWFKIYEEFLFLFNDQTKKEILDYDLNNKALTLSESISKQDNVFTSDYQGLLVPEIKKIYADRVRSKQAQSPFDEYWLGAEEYNKNNYQEATKWLTRSLEKGLTSAEVYFKLYDSLAKLNNTSYQDVSKLISARYQYKQQGRLAPFHRRLVRKIIRTLKKR